MKETAVCQEFVNREGQILNFLTLFTVKFFQSLNFMRMASRVDAVAQRVQSAVQMRQVGDCYHSFIILQ